MTFDVCVRNYPIDETLVGSYGCDQSFKINDANSIDDIETWPNQPLDWGDDSAFPFVVYNEAENLFEGVYFGFWRIKGYINPTGLAEDFYPATNSPDFGWEIIDPDKFNEDIIVWPTISIIMNVANQMNRPEMLEYDANDRMREQIAWMYNNELYEKGYIFTTYEQLKKFVHKKFSE